MNILEIKLTCYYILQCNKSIGKFIKCFLSYFRRSAVKREKSDAWSMQWIGKIISPGKREDICSSQFLDAISVINPPVTISQQVFGLCKKDFEDINSSFI